MKILYSERSESYEQRSERKSPLQQNSDIGIEEQFRINSISLGGKIEYVGEYVGKWDKYVIVQIK
jgi:hypothetical protein